MFTPPNRAQRLGRGFRRSPSIYPPRDPRRSRWALLFVIAIAGCQPTPPVTVRRTPATTRSLGPQTFDAPSLGIAFNYPAGWTPDAAATAEEALRVVNGSAVLTLTVPKLPFHIPGMIPINLVASGYADDVRKRLPDAAGPAAQVVTLSDAQARRVTLTGHEPDGRTITEDAVLIVHGDRVYVLATDADPAARPAAASALDAAVASVRWTK